MDQFDVFCNDDVHLTSRCQLNHDPDNDPDYEFTKRNITTLRINKQLFSSEIERLKFPKSLRMLDFGKYDGPINNIKFSCNLHTIKLSDNYDHFIGNDVRFPDNLYVIEFGKRYNSSVDYITFPDGLHTIKFGDDFNIEIDNVTFPDELHTIKFGHNYNRCLDNVKFPESLRKIVFGAKYSKCIDNVSFPTHIHTFDLINANDDFISKIYIQQQLKTVIINKYCEAMPKLPYGCVCRRYDVDNLSFVE